MPKEKLLLSVVETQRYHELKNVVRRNSAAAWAWAEALREIQENKLFKDEYESFQDFLFAETGYSKARAYQLIRAIKYREQQKSLSGNGEAATVPETVSQATEMQSQAAQKQADPPSSDPQNNGKTESSILDANNVACQCPKPDEDTKVVDVEVVEKSDTDRMGYPLPKEVADSFRQWHITQRLAKKLSEVKMYVAHAKESGDPLFAALSNAWIVGIEKVIFELKATMPYAVCPFCQGMNPQQCTNCNHTGWVGSFFYERAVPEELRTMRNHQIQQLIARKGHATKELSGRCGGGDSARV
jgi:hypothetical protein